MLRGLIQQGQDQKSREFTHCRAGRLSKTPTKSRCAVVVDNARLENHHDYTKQDVSATRQQYNYKHSTTQKSGFEHHQQYSNNDRFRNRHHKKQQAPPIYRSTSPHFDTPSQQFVPIDSTQSHSQVSILSSFSNGNRPVVLSSQQLGMNHHGSHHLASNHDNHDQESHHQNRHRTRKSRRKASRRKQPSDTQSAVCHSLSVSTQQQAYHGSYTVHARSNQHHAMPHHSQAPYIPSNPTILPMITYPHRRDPRRKWQEQQQMLQQQYNRDASSNSLTERTNHSLNATSPNADDDSPLCCPQALDTATRTKLRRSLAVSILSIKLQETLQEQENDGRIAYNPAAPAYEHNTGRLKYDPSCAPAYEHDIGRLEYDPACPHYNP